MYVDLVYLPHPLKSLISAYPLHPPTHVSQSIRGELGFFHPNVTARKCQSMIDSSIVFPFSNDNILGAGGKLPFRIFDAHPPMDFNREI